MKILCKKSFVIDAGRYGTEGQIIDVPDNVGRLAIAYGMAVLADEKNLKAAIVSDPEKIETRDPVAKRR